MSNNSSNNNIQESIDVVVHFRRIGRNRELFSFQPGSTTAEELISSCLKKWEYSKNHRRWKLLLRNQFLIKQNLDGIENGDTIVLTEEEEEGATAVKQEENNLTTPKPIINDYKDETTNRYKLKLSPDTSNNSFINLIDSSGNDSNDEEKTTETRFPLCQGLNELVNVSAATITATIPVKKEQDTFDIPDNGSKDSKNMGTLSETGNNNNILRTFKQETNEEETTVEEEKEENDMVNLSSERKDGSTSYHQEITKDDSAEFSSQQQQQVNVVIVKREEECFKRDTDESSEESPALSNNNNNENLMVSRRHRHHNSRSIETSLPLVAGSKEKACFKQDTDEDASSSSNDDSRIEISESLDEEVVDSNDYKKYNSSIIIKVSTKTSPAVVTKNEDNPAVSVTIKREKDAGGNVAEIGEGTRRRKRRKTAIEDDEYTKILIRRAKTVTSIPAFNPSADDENGTDFTFFGKDYPTGKLWWKQYDELEDWKERGKKTLDIEAFHHSAKPPMLTRWRSFRSIQNEPGTCILNDEDNLCYWYVQKRGEERRYSQSASVTQLSRNILREIFYFVIDNPKAHHSLALTCHEFAFISEERSMVVHTATVTTRDARIAQSNAQRKSKEAKRIARSSSANEVIFTGNKKTGVKPGKWRGERLNKKSKVHGLGVFRFNDTDQGYSAGYFDRNGYENGPCNYVYPDQSAYSGELKKGERHGNGVNFENKKNPNCRYEGSWVSDKKSGYGLALGYPGQWPFMFGKWKNDDTISDQIVWNFNSDTVIVKEEENRG